jgi:hypothetical protein
VVNKTGEKNEPISRRMLLHFIFIFTVVLLLLWKQDCSSLA